MSAKKAFPLRINEDVYQAALLAPDLAKVHGQDIELEAPYIAEMVRHEVVARYGWIYSLCPCQNPDSHFADIRTG